MLIKTLRATGLLSGPCSSSFAKLCKSHSPADSKRSPVVLTANLASSPCPRAHSETQWEYIVERQLWATLYHMLIHFISLIWTMLINNCFVSLSVRGQGHVNGRPKVSQCINFDSLSSSALAGFHLEKQSTCLAWFVLQKCIKEAS